MKSAHGFASILIIGLILALGSFGFVFYKVYINPPKQQFRDEAVLPTPASKTNISTNSSNLNPSPSLYPANWKTYTSKKYQFSIRYPAEYQVQEDNSNMPLVIGPSQNTDLNGQKVSPYIVPQIWLEVKPRTPEKSTLDLYIPNCSTGAENKNLNNRETILVQYNCGLALTEILIWMDNENVYFLNSYDQILPVFKFTQ